MPAQSGVTSTPLEPHAEQTKRRAPAMAGKGVSGAKPIAAKAMGVDRRQTGLQHVTHAPATPWDWRSAIVGGTIVMQNRSLRNFEIRREMDRRLILAALMAWPWPALAGDLPINPAVTQETIQQTICVPGWTKTVRPSASYTARIKIKLIRELELDEALLVDFELDHRIPLALGGAPSDPRNLELQPWDEAGEKDAIEACLARAVCAGKIGLDEARRRIWSDWRHVGASCDGEISRN